MKKNFALTRYDLTLLVAAGKTVYKRLPKSKEKDSLATAIRRAQSVVKNF